MFIHFYNIHVGSTGYRLMEKDTGKTLNVMFTSVKHLMILIYPLRILQKLVLKKDEKSLSIMARMQVFNANISGSNAYL